MSDRPRRLAPPPPRSTELKVVVNPLKCVAHGLCADLLGEWITLDDWGYPIIDPRPLPPELEAHARRAAAACPTLAIVLRREPAKAP